MLRRLIMGMPFLLLVCFILFPALYVGTFLLLRMVFGE